MSPRRLSRRWDDSISDLLTKVSIETHVSKGQLQSMDRTPAVVRARIVAWLVLRAEGCSFPVIGKLTGGFDHSTVMHGIGSATEREYSLSNKIMGNDLGQPVKVPQVNWKGGILDREMKRRELLFRSHAQRWRELCGEDSQYAANKALVGEHFDRMREVKQAQKSGVQ